MIKWERGPRWNSGLVRYATDDASKTLQAKPTGQKTTVYVVQILATIITSAAQTVTIAAGSTTIAVIPPSLAVGTQLRFGPFYSGMPGQASQDLAITSTAGYAIDFIAEGFFD